MSSLVLINASCADQVVDAVVNAANRGVNICAVNCNVEEDGLEIDRFVDVKV